MGVSWTGGIPKWMVDFMDNPIFKKNALGVPPFQTSIWRDGYQSMSIHSSRQIFEYVTNLKILGWAWFPLLTMIPITVSSQWFHNNLPRFKGKWSDMMLTGIFMEWICVFPSYDSHLWWNNHSPCSRFHVTWRSLWISSHVWWHRKGSVFTMVSFWSFQTVMENHVIICNPSIYSLL